MRTIRILPLLLCLLLLACSANTQKTDEAAPTANAEQGMDDTAISADDVVLTVGSEPVYAVVYRYHLAERLRAIEQHGLYDREKYLAYVSNPNFSYVYAYYDTHTEEGMRALASDVLTELALEAAAIDAGTKAGYQITAQEQTYLYQAKDNALNVLDDQLKAYGGTYESREAFYAETGFTEDRFVEMYERNMKAGVLYERLLDDYKASHTLTEDEIQAGYERVVNETFRDRYTDGIYSQYLSFYLSGARSFPSLYVPDDAIFVRLFVNTDPTDAEKASIQAQAEADFNALYNSTENEFTAQGTAGDLAIAPNDSLADGLYDAAKDVPKEGDRLILLGGDNYRIGMGGGAVSSVNTGQYGNAIELNAIQRANAEMQKRDYNAIRALAEMDRNPIVSVHDHGAGGHLNCLSELVEETGGKVDISKLPVGDPTLSLKEIIGNESQERMGLALKKKDVALLKRIAERERAPFYEIGEVTSDGRFILRDEKSGQTAIDLQMSDMFGSAPKTVMDGKTLDYKFNPLKFSPKNFTEYLEQVLALESVGCKDWLTNKVDRSVTGLIALQQCCGKIQLPLNNLAVTAIGYDNKEGIATSIGHAPVAGLIDSAAGSRLSIAEALTNIVWTPLKGGLNGVSLSANWMWPSRNPGEDSRLYRAVEAVSNFAISLGINIPTGKDSMSMTQTYPDGSKVLAPGTVIISAAAPADDVSNTVTPVLKNVAKSSIIYIPFSKGRNELGGSAFAQALGQIGNKAPDIDDPAYFSLCFNAIQAMVRKRLILAGHDISAGGMITSLLEMCFANQEGSLEIFGATLPITEFFFSEKPGVLIQVADRHLKEVEALLADFADEDHPEGVTMMRLGRYIPNRKGGPRKRYLKILGIFKIDIDRMRDIWYRPSYNMELRQTSSACARQRKANYRQQPLEFKFPKGFSGHLPEPQAGRENAPVAAIIREKGSNGDREMAWCLHIAGFRVKDVHMTDLTTGRENLKDVQMIVFVGGFSNADTLGSAKGWAGAFLHNSKAKKALDDFYARKDTLSLGICNGCQLMAELGLITPQDRSKSPKLAGNLSGKFESAFVGVKVPRSSSILLNGLQGSKLGIWVAHGEGRFVFPEGNLPKGGKTKDMQVALRYSYDKYPGNPNGSPMGIAGVCSPDGRHLAMMPHPERCLRPWNWALYPSNRKDADQVTPWLMMFTAAAIWCKNNC